MPTKRVSTTCTRDCPNTCGLIADVENGKVTRLYGNPAHPLNQGRVCGKCRGFVDRVYHPERVLEPLRKDGDKFMRISWDEALDEIALRIKAVCEKNGAQSILYYQGFGARTALKLVNRRFFNHLGPVTFTKGTICGGTGQASQDLDFGERISHDFRDYENSGSLILWGRNPAATNTNILPVMKSIRERGGKVILIDPLETPTARLCDIVIKPRPGRDAWLALALSRLIFERNAADDDFLAGHCDNLEEYKRIVFKYEIDYLSACCDVPVPQIEETAQVLIEKRPAGFLLGWGLHRWEYAHTAIRAIDALAAVCGSIGVSGGGASQGFEEYLPYDWDVWGDYMNPGARRLLMPDLGNELLNADPPIELLVVSGGNPMTMLPDTGTVRRAFDSIPFKVVIGHFLDDTGLTADIFLPTTTFLEDDDAVASYGHSYVGKVQRAIAPLGEAKSDFDIFMLLGSRFSFAKEYVKPADEWLDIIMRPTWNMGIEPGNLSEGGFFQPNVPFVPYKDKVFPTDTGNFKLLDSFETGVSAPDEPAPSGDYYLMSTAPSQWLCSEITPGQFNGKLPVSINTQEAARLGLSQGDDCVLYNELGKLACQVVCNDTQRTDLVYVPRGRWDIDGCNVNVLTRAVVSRVGKGAAYYETIVHIQAATD